eukprot:10398012-Lingulodinium_polyedra.AAC.1
MPIPSHVEGAQDMYELSTGFPEISVSDIETERWHVRFAHRVRDVVHNGVLESRGVVAGVRRKVRGLRASDAVASA